MIKVENLVKRYNGTTVVDQLSFEIQEGQNLMLLGTSGCGKTTTLRMINRLIEPDEGAVYLNNENINLQQPEVLRRGIGYVLQNHGLFPHYTIAENVAIVPQLLKWDSKRIRRRTLELFEKLKLEIALLNQYPGSLSGGQQQRVGLARALMTSPSVLLMDEPFGALDNITRINIRKEFKQLDELVKKTIIMVTHDVQEAFELGDVICLMDKGKVMQVGTPRQLLFNPQNEFVTEFLKEQRMQLELKTLELTDERSVWDAMLGWTAEELRNAMLTYQK
ncbi:ABC transporter ATP-binding protein [Pedobacter sp. MC2016-14]|uniref:ABC transporter ATP-binding protein n=1 Tax=Pedobacter sp. MC2016-14 TaxID=2897327 RepID=UPI001E30029E|nr:ABC transporter ATP-binding protein [Pedobacter sp. MC2016-14]MCD0490240.1 ABC transporter ATP-binding protein [Pedobacter sp. MC2016-14]